jgi:hypothetical protein
LEHGRGILDLRLNEAFPVLGILEPLAAQLRVPNDRIEYPMGGVERRHCADVLELRLREVDYDRRERYPLSISRLSQSFFEPVGLALHAIDEDAQNVLPRDAPELEDMARRVAPPLRGVGRREYLVPLPTDGLQPPKASNGRIVLNRGMQAIELQHVSLHSSPVAIRLGVTMTNTLLTGSYAERQAVLRLAHPRQLRDPAATRVAAQASHEGLVACFRRLDAGVQGAAACPCRERTTAQERTSRTSKRLKASGLVHDELQSSLYGVAYVSRCQSRVPLSGDPGATARARP